MRKNAWHGPGARPGPGPAGPWASEEKPKKTLGFLGFSIRRMDGGWTVAGHREGHLGPG